MPRLREHPFEAGEITINYAEGGAADGPPLVLLHGLAARWQAFGPLLPALSLDWHLYAPDFRGHGASGKAPGHYGLPDYVRDTLAFLRAKVTPPAVLYGHSLGGWVGEVIAAEHPELVRALIIGDSALWTESLDPDMSISYLTDLPIALRSLAKSLTQLDPDALAAFRDGRLVADYDPDRLLPKITCPVLLLQGNPAHGSLMTDADAARALAILPDARHRRFDDLGHGLHVENAEPILAAVTGFLEGLRTED
jgi:pimeloyl-ACP methyl ester carboxylesterase